MMTGIKLIAAERNRQIEKEGWTEEHDDEHDDGELALAAACYAIPDSKRNPNFSINGLRFKQDLIFYLWPFNEASWKPNEDNRIRELEKAGALIAAEIDRLLRVK
jgi:hypothetical protein